jgi:hypothetical protein
MCIASLTPFTVANILSGRVVVEVQTRDSPMEQKLKFQLSDCFNGSCREIRTRVIVGQK